MNKEIESLAFKELKNVSWWVQRSYKSVSKDLLLKLDYIAKLIEKTDDNKDVLLSKIRNIYNKNDKKDYTNISLSELDKDSNIKEERLFSLFSEIMLYEELVNKGFYEVELIKESHNTSPDFSAEKDGIKYYFEVKRIRAPVDESENFRSRCLSTSAVNKDFRYNLIKKIGFLLCKASIQLESQEDKLKIDQKICVLDYCAGVDTIIQVGPNTSIEKIFNKETLDILSIEHDLIIWPRLYF